MSRFCGKSDLYDTIFMIKAEQGDTDMDCFNRFMEETGGVIYQLIRVPLNTHNIKFECDMVKANPELSLYSPGLSRVEHKEVVEDKRFKDGHKTKTTYTYKLMNREFSSISEINDFGYSRKKKIKISSILDLIPYFPYIISMATFRDNHWEIIIGDTSYVKQMENNQIKWGYTSSMIDYYNNELKEYLIKCIKENY